MRALTVVQPYAHALAEGWKPVENRSWLPSAKLLRPGEDFVIHAGVKKVGADDSRFVYEMAGDVARSFLPLYGQAIAVATYEGPVTAEWLSQNPEGARWFFGFEDNHGWIISNVRKLKKPVACKGMLGLWTVPAEVAKKISEQLRG